MIIDGRNKVIDGLRNKQTQVCSVILVWLRDFYRDFAHPDLARTHPITPNP